VVGQSHEIAGVKGFVDAAGGVGEEEGAGGELGQGADRECDALHFVAFVIMDAAFKGDNGSVVEVAENEFASMAADADAREAGQLGIRNLGRALQAGQGMVKAAAEDHGEGRSGGDELANDGGG
jgi:hypothetical protein